MLPNKSFLRQSKKFWAHVRLISQRVGYTVRGQGTVRVPTMLEMVRAFERVGLCTHQMLRINNNPTKLGQCLLDYFAFRAKCLNNYVEPRLMDARRAKREYQSLRRKLKPSCPQPMNKQRGTKRAPAYLTCIVNMLVEANSKGHSCDFDPRQLTTITRDGVPVRTLARRIDGAFSSAVDPIAVWEIKEYYYTTTFGSRVADGVYESLLDGMELEELRSGERIDVKHYLFVDAHYTWWTCGKSYLCRIIDMLHMGYVDEVLFGYEVIERLPKLVKDWVTLSIAQTMHDRQRQRGHDVK